MIFGPAVLLEAVHLFDLNGSCRAKFDLSLGGALAMAVHRKRYPKSELLAESRHEVQFAPVPTKDGDGRAFPRYYFRTLATATIHPVPVIGTETQECYVLTRDLSRGGVSFLHPRRLVLGQRVDLTFEDGRELLVRVRWIKPLEKRCFLIGCRFIAVTDDAAA